MNRSEYISKWANIKIKLNGKIVALKTSKTKKNQLNDTINNKGKKRLIKEEMNKKIENKQQ